jgi:hypothetical protein
MDIRFKACYLEKISKYTICPDDFFVSLACSLKITFEVFAFYLELAMAMYTSTAFLHESKNRCKWKKDIEINRPLRNKGELREAF